MISAIGGFQAPRENSQSQNESSADYKKKDKRSSKGKIKINLKHSEAQEGTRYTFLRKSSMDYHQRSNNEQSHDFDSLLDQNIKENVAATERHTSSLIDNFDQSDFIRNVIIQSKKVGGNRFGSPGQVNPDVVDNQRPAKREAKNFMKDMKKHGILKAFNDINKFTEFFQSSPSWKQEVIEGHGINWKHFSSWNLEYDNEKSSIQEIANAANDKNTKSTYILEEMEKEEKEPNKTLKSFKFIFPFQRRARSHSPPKNSVISNKIIETMNNNSPDGILAQSSIRNDNEANNKGKGKAVIANPNFLIGSYHLLNKKENLNSLINASYTEEEPMLQGKEVEEWLMGSGMSIPDATTGCTDNSELTKQFSSNLSGFLNTLKNRQMEKQNESPKKKWIDDWGELEEWMFSSLNNEKDEFDEEKEDEQIPDENGLEGSWFSNIPEFSNHTKRSPYVHKDQIIEEEEELESEFVDTNDQFGFKNLNSYISQMDKWIEEGRTFK